MTNPIHTVCEVEDNDGDTVYFTDGSADFGVAMCHDEWVERGRPNAIRVLAVTAESPGVLPSFRHCDVCGKPPESSRPIAVVANLGVGRLQSRVLVMVEVSGGVPDINERIVIAAMISAGIEHGRLRGNSVAWNVLW